jgi:cysteine-rich repeat protein
MIRMMPWPTIPLALFGTALGSACYSPHLPATGGPGETSGSTAASSDATTTSSAQESSTAGSTAGSDDSTGTGTGAPADSGSDTATGDGCGNGVVDGSELCDDGDRIDGNGCNNDCTPSGQVVWTVTYDGTEHLSDSPSRIAVASDDSVIVVGHEGATPDSLPLIHRYDGDGIALWQNTFTVAGGGGEATGVAVSLDDEIVVSAQDAIGSTGVLTRFSLDGVVDDEIATAMAPHDVVVDANGRIFTCGRATMAPDPQRLWISAYSEFGNQLWEFVESEGTQGSASGLALVEDDGVAVVGQRDDSMVVERRNADGDRLWLHTFGLDGYDIAGAAGLGVAVTGSDTVPNAFVSAFDIEGDITWMDVADVGQAFADGITFDLLGNVVVAGTVYNNAFSSDALVMKYDAAGSLLWSEHWDIDESSPLDATQAHGVAIDSAGAILLTGNSEPQGSGATDIWVRKLTP